MECTYHEVSLNEIKLVSKLFFDSVLLCSADLIRIDIQTGDVGSSKLDDFSCWTSNATANIQHSHARLDANAAG